MKKYTEMNLAELTAQKSRLEEAYEEILKKGYKLDLSRGKPSSNQLDLSAGVIETGLLREDCFGADGVDYRNYGLLEGVPAMKALFSELYGVPAERIIIGGNASLQLMYDTLATAMLYGFKESPKPWAAEPARKWICVTPGYDRHFAITEKMGFELLSVPMTKDGPDMEKVEELVKDPAVKGIWCVPKYSNPTGNTYSDETVSRLASMKTAAPDFRIFWDNAYGIHDFGEDGEDLADIFAACEAAGNPNRPIYFASTSKISHPGAGVSFLAASDDNRATIKSAMTVQTIGYDKLNQLRHLKYFKNADGVRAHMKKLGAVIKRKFDIAEEILAPLKDEGIAAWVSPKGGYFISLDVLPGCAARVYELMKNAGVTLTKVGATYPHGKDPADRNLRLAPTYPSEEDLAASCRVLLLAVRLAAVEKLLTK